MKHERTLCFPKPKQKLITYEPLLPSSSLMFPQRALQLPILVPKHHLHMIRVWETRPIELWWIIKKELLIVCGKLQMGRACNVRIYSCSMTMFRLKYLSPDFVIKY